MQKRMGELSSQMPAEPFKKGGSPVGGGRYEVLEPSSCTSTKSFNPKTPRVEMDHN